MTTHLFSGYTGSDLTTDAAMAVGDSITVPGGAPTHRFAIEDDDARMSGDTVTDDRSDDPTQSAQVWRGATLVRSGPVYLDEIYVLRDADGNDYVLYEMGIEGTSEDFYVFQDPPPPPGSTLTVVAREDAAVDDGGYEQFAGDDSFEGRWDGGSPAADTLSGGAGNDTLYGGGNDDTLYGGDGADKLQGGDGNDALYGGAGDDTLHGDAGADTLYGGTGDDRLFGGSGDDTLFGGEGHDHIETGAGSDTVWAGAGDDEIDDRGDAAIGDHNIILGEAGDDQIRTGAAIDWVSGGIGDDTVWAGEGDDLLLGDAGDDTLHGEGGDDELIGGAGSDMLFGGAGDDVLVTGGLADDAAPARDGAHGGAGDDLFLPSEDFDDAMIVGGETGEVDGDTIDLGGSHVFDNGHVHTAPTRDYTLDLSNADAESGSISDGNATWTFSDIENIRLGAGTDTLRLSNGSGHDRVLGFEAPTKDTDGIWTGKDRIDLRGMTTADGRQVNVNDVSVIDDGAGNAKLLFPGGESVTLVGVAPADVSSDGALIAMGVSAPDGTVSGSAGDDLIDADYRGDPEGEVVDGGDSVTTPGSDADVIEAGDGNDRVEAGAGDDTVYGGDGSDNLRGGDGDDTLYGGTGADRIDGGAGNDTVDVGGDAFGSDTVVMSDGGGEDVVLNFAPPVANPDGSYTPRDRLDVSGLSDASGDPVNVWDVEVTAATDGSGDAVLGFPNGESLRLVGVPAAEVSAPKALIALGVPGSDGTVSGTAGADAIVAGYVDEDGDRVDGGDAILSDRSGDSDVIEAGDGNDRVEAGDGNDLVFGGKGDDTISGGAGDDTLWGDAGSDRFVLEDGFGHDTIRGGEDAGGGETDTLDAGDLTSGVDVVFSGDEAGRLEAGAHTADFSEVEAIKGSAQADTLDAGATGSGVTLHGGGGEDMIRGGDGADGLFGGADADRIAGGRGADRIEGGAGGDMLRISDGDTVFGGAGDDLIRFEDLGEAPADTTVSGGDGIDTLDLGHHWAPETLSKVSDGMGGFSGSVKMDNGATLSFSKVERVICFTAGTRIATPFGPRRAEELQVGDLVLTRDHGPQPLRWTGSRRAAAIGACAPIRIRPGVLPGLERDLLVSPQHRMLFEGYRAQLLFGEDEVLVAARHLVDGRDVTVETGGEVIYVHLLFDSHEIVMAEGAATESFQPGLRGIIGLDGPSRARLLEACPGLRSMPDGWGPSARPTLRAHEARALFA